MAPLETEGYELWDVEFVRAGREKELRVFVDKDGGIGIDELEVVSRMLSDGLDADDRIEGAYTLIVSSPGMDRALLKDEHFERYAGQPVEVSLYKGFCGYKKFPALLGSKSPDGLRVTPVDALTLAPKDDEMLVPGELVSKVRLLVVF